MNLMKYIKKNLAGLQDLFFGEGYVTQERNGGNYRIDGIRGFWPVNTQEEFDAIDPVSHPKIVYVFEGRAYFYQYTGTAWEQVAVDAAATVNDAFTSYVFKRSITAPAKPADDEGSYANPVPAGWSDGIPDGEEALWSTSRVLSRTGEYPQSDSWTDVAKMADTATVDYEWSSVSAAPGTPDTNPENWNNDPDTDTVWMAIKRTVNGVPGSWQVVRIRGEDGNNGTPGNNGSRGAGRYYADTLPAPYTWLSGDVAANAAANAACPGGTPVEGDTVTLFKPGDRTVSVSKLYSSGVWVAFAQVIPGNLLVQGTVVADTIRAGAIFGENAFFTGTVYAENIEGDIAEFTALLSTTVTWVDTEVGEKVIRTFSVTAAPFIRVLSIPSIAVEGAGTWTTYVRKSDGGPNPLSWPVMPNSGSAKFLGTTEGRFSYATVYVIPANVATSYAITITRGNILEAPTGAAIHTQQQIVLGAFKYSANITA